MAYSDPSQPMVQSREIPIRTLVVKMDPDFENEKRKEPEYKYGDRVFYGNVTRRGAYADDVVVQLPWLLATGQWDDSGGWDDTAFWKDS